MSAGKTTRLAVVSLGCPKNLVDMERAVGQLISAGVVLVEDPAEADWVLVNTCGFINEAKQESIDTILEIAQLRASNPGLKIAVSGCLSQRYGQALGDELGEVDFVTGILTRVNANELLRAMTGLSVRISLPEYSDSGRLRITPRHMGYLRISEGCDNCCAYCAIPSIRGGLVSRPFETVLSDAAELVADGVVEMNVIAQDTTSYGVDLYGRYRLAELLRELRPINPRGWIRLLYAHPAHFSDDVIDAIAEGPPIVPYVDLPLQHINDRLLRTMGRIATRPEVESLIGKLRSRVPGVYIRTAFIVGFPGETKQEFDELLAFVERTRFERLGAFEYSKEEGTRAASMKPQVPAKERTRRLDALMRAQAGIAREFNASLVGRDVSCIIDGPSGRDDLPLQGRTIGDAPEVDGTVYTSGGLEYGRIATLRITGVEDYDLLAEVAP